MLSTFDTHTYEQQEPLAKMESNGKEELNSRDPNEEDEVQGRGCHAWISTKTKEKKEEMMENTFLGLDLMKTFFWSKIC